jgi:hypothetical protein
MWVTPFILLSFIVFYAYITYIQNTNIIVITIVGNAIFCHVEQR